MIGILTEAIGNPTPADHPAGPGAAAAERRWHPPGAVGTVAFPPVDRLLDDRQPRDPRPRVALSRGPALQLLADGPQFDRARQQGQLDDDPEHDPRRREGWRREHRGRTATAAALALAAAAVGAVAAVPTRTRTPPCSATRRGAIRAATSSRQTSRSSHRRSTSSRRWPPPASRSRRPRPTSPSTARAIRRVVHRPGDQAFRPHVLDMFEPQWHPMDLQYPGGPPKRPYDNAGYTLAFQMGFKFDRILDGFTAPVRAQSSRTRDPRSRRI